MFRQALLILSATTFVASPAFAGGTSPFSVAIGGGTLGLTGEVGFKADRLGVRGNINYFHYSGNSTRSGVGFTDDVELKSYGILADLYPMENGFRITGGLMINKNRFGIKGSPNQTAKIGSNTYSGSEVSSLSGSVENNLIAPYIGAGYVADFASGLQISADIGALLQGKSTVNLTSSNGSISQSDLNEEAASIKSQADQYMFYPVLSIKAGYRF